MHDDATQPKRADVIPPDIDLEKLAQQDPMYPDDFNEHTGPGCWAWGIMALFAVLLAIGIVVTAALAGFNQGLDTARVTAAVATNQNISRQCQILPTDIAAQRFEVIESRFEALTIDGQLPDCASVFVQQATIIFEQSQATARPSPTMTAPATIAATQAIEASTALSTPVSTSDSPYDLNGLLVEARSSIASVEYDDAIETLDAIRAIDPDFETTTVTGLLFNALTQQATLEFRSPNGSLARGILLTNRAEQFGDIQILEISFERSVAELYLDAQANLGLNYQIAVSLLSQTVGLSPNYPRGTGVAATQLFEQYQAYGDALLLGGDACLAQSQFQNALSLRPNNPALQTKITTATQQCALGVPATVDPNATLDPNATAAPISNATPTSGVAPVGQGS